MLARLICLLLGHELVFQQNKSHIYGVCLWCGHRTPGWTYGEQAKKTNGTQACWDALYDECMETELALHGGG